MLQLSLACSSYSAIQGDSYQNVRGSSTGSHHYDQMGSNSWRPDDAVACWIHRYDSLGCYIRGDADRAGEGRTSDESQIGQAINECSLWWRGSSKWHLWASLIVLLDFLYSLIFTAVKDYSRWGGELSVFHLHPLCHFLICACLLAHILAQFWLFFCWTQRKCWALVLALFSLH